jgi:hypothetical protein
MLLSARTRSEQQGMAIRKQCARFKLRMFREREYKSGFGASRFLAECCCRPPE